MQRLKIANNQIYKKQAARWHRLQQYRYNHCEKRRYEATGGVKTKILRPVNKKIIPEKHDLFDNCEQGYEF